MKIRKTGLYTVILVLICGLFAACAHTKAAQTGAHGKDAVLIEGQVSERKLIKGKKPVIPDGILKKDGVSTVKFYFFVTPGGRVSDKIMTVKSSGYAGIDGSSKDALLKFRFEPLDIKDEQAGYATFTHYAREVTK